MAWRKIRDLILSQFDNGTFEAAKSQWGSYFEPVALERSAEFADQGTYSGKLTEASFSQATSIPAWVSKQYGRVMIQFYTPNLTPGRYVISGKVLIPTAGWPLGEGVSLFMISYVGTHVGGLSHDVTYEEDWVEIQHTFEITTEASALVQIIAAWNSGYTTGAGRTDGQTTFIDTFKLYELADIPDLAVIATPTDCTYHGSNDGSIVLSNYDDLSEDYSVVWSHGPVDVFEVTGLAAGTYSVTITDNLNGRVQVISDIVVSQPGPASLVVDVVKTDVTCHGAANGSINISVSNGDGNYTYQWTDGPTTQNRTGLGPGTYIVLVEDGLTATGFAEVVITEPDEIVINATVDGTNIYIEVTGGTAPYSYAWADGPTSSDRTNVEPGEYTLDVTDANGCTAQIVVQVSDFRFKFSQDPVILELDAINPESKPNLSFKCEVYVERVYQSGNYDLIATLEQPADSAGATVFDVQSILDGVEELKTHLPAANQASVSIADGIFKRFYLRYTERYGDPPDDAPFSQSDIQYVVLGGLSYEEYASDYFFTNYLNKYPFFTWQANGRHVFTDEPHFLYFMVPEFGVAEFHVNVRVNYTDGTFVDFNPFAYAGVMRYELYCIPAGFTQLAIAAQSVKDVFSYSIQVTDGNAKPLSEKRTFLVIRDHFSFRRFFMYRNAIGGFDTLAATAMSEMKASAKGNTIVKDLPYNYAIEDGEEQIIRKDLERELESGSGYLRRKVDVQRMQDFIGSEDVFLFENNRYIPVLITAKGVVEDDNGDPMGIRFTAQLPKSRNYTPYLAGENIDAPVGGGDEYLAVNDVLLKINK